MNAQSKAHEILLAVLGSPQVPQAVKDYIYTQLGIVPAEIAQLEAAFAVLQDALATQPQKEAAADVVLALA